MTQHDRNSIVLSGMSTLLMTEGVAQRATVIQERVNIEQIMLMREFLRVGNSKQFAEVKEKVLERVCKKEAWRYHWWDQAIIFLFLKTICPEGRSLDSFVLVEQVKEAFASFTREYSKFFEMLDVPLVHRSLTEQVEPLWLRNKRELLHFIGEDCDPAFCPNYWAYLGVSLRTA